MPADKHQNIEGAFLEESWILMRETLDKELPIGKKPMPSGKPWFTLILLLLFAWTTYLYWPEQRVEVSNDSEQEDYLIEALPAIALSTIENQSAIQDQFSFLENRVESNSKSKLTSHFSGSLVGNDEVLRNDNSGTTAFFNSVGHNLVLELNSVPVFINGSSIRTVETPFSIEIVKSESVELLSAKDPHVFKKENSRVFAPEALGKKDYGLSVGLKYEAIIDRSALSGKFIGIQVEKPLSPQFSVLAALGITDLQKLSTADSSFETFREFYNMEVSHSGDINALSSGLPIIYGYDEESFSVIGIDKLTYISLPLELAFAVNPRIRVLAGFALSYMISAEITTSEEVSSWIDHEKGTVIKDQNELIGTAIQRFDISPSIGFSIKPTRRLAVELKFKNGLLDISKDKFLGFNEFHSNRYLHLGLSYDIFNKR